jgi:hypothetical protein
VEVMGGLNSMHGDDGQIRVNGWKRWADCRQWGFGGGRGGTESQVGCSSVVEAGGGIQHIIN